MRGPTPSEPFRLGLEVCLESPPPVLAGRRLGLLVNQASVDRRFRYAHDLVAERFPGRVTALFGPQHGLWSEQQDDMRETPHARHARLGVPVFSLYADRREPAPEMLAEIDVLVVDLQDVGTRVYTWGSTLLGCLRACAAHGVPVVVLDRPNPVGGEVVEGPLLEPGFESFVGLARLPMRHALTLGELARHFERTLRLGAELHVVAMRGYRRALLWPDLARAWVPPSPNLPRFEGALVYPGQVLLEGTNLSEGRGTTTPFEVCGAPWVDGERLARALEERALPGLTVRPVRFVPTFHKFAGQSCGGVFLHPTDARALRPYRTTLALLAEVAELWPEHFAWRGPPYEYETVKPPIDVITGSSRVRETLARDRVAELAAVDVAAWRSATRPDRLYD